MGHPDSVSVALDFVKVDALHGMQFFLKLKIVLHLVLREVTKRECEHDLAVL